MTYGVVRARVAKSAGMMEGESGVVVMVGALQFCMATESSWIGRGYMLG